MSLRSLLAREGCLTLSGVYAGTSARMTNGAGIEALNMTGFGVVASALGWFIPVSRPRRPYWTSYAASPVPCGYRSSPMGIAARADNRVPSSNCTPSGRIAAIPASLRGLMDRPA